LSLDGVSSLCLERSPLPRGATKTKEKVK